MYLDEKILAIELARLAAFVIAAALVFFVLGSEDGRDRTAFVFYLSAAAIVKLVAAGARAYLAPKHPGARIPSYQDHEARLIYRCSIWGDEDQSVTPAELITEQGAALKLAMNQLIAGLTSCFSLSLGLVRAEGIEVAQFMDLLRGSALYAPTFDKKLDKYLSHEYGKANFPLKHLLKDVRLFGEVAEKAGMDTAFLTAVERACIRARERGYAEQDYSAVYEAVVSE